MALLRGAKALKKLLKSDSLTDDQRVGVNIVGRAIEEPMRWIAHNAGQEGSIIVNKVRELEGDQGYNAAKGKYENLVNSGVIDPTKVVRYALQNASSIAGLMLTTEALVCELPEKENNKGGGGAPGGMPPGMGDMGDF